MPTLVVAPLARPGFVRAQPRLTPTLLVLGAPMLLVTHELAAVDRRRLRGPPLDNLAAFSFEIQNALDVVFSAAG